MILHKADLIIKIKITINWFMNSLPLYFSLLPFTCISVPFKRGPYSFSMFFIIAPLSMKVLSIRIIKGALSWFNIIKKMPNIFSFRIDLKSLNFISILIVTLIKIIMFNGDAKTRFSIVYNLSKVQLKVWI